MLDKLMTWLFGVRVVTLTYRKGTEHQQHVFEVGYMGMWESSMTTAALVSKGWILVDCVKGDTISGH